MYDLSWIDPMYIENVHQFVEEAKRNANKQNKNDIFCPCVDCKNKIAWLDSKIVQSHLIKRGFKRNYTVWIKHGEIDDTLLELDIGIGDNNSHGQDDGVFTCNLVCLNCCLINSYLNNLLKQFAC